MVEWMLLLYILNRIITVPLLFKGGIFPYISGGILILSFIITFSFISNENILLAQEYINTDLHYNAITLNVNKQKLWLLFILINITSFATGLLTQFLRQKEIRIEAEQKRKDAEIALYKSRINPHFLYNTANSIYSLIVTKSDLAEQAFMNFTELMHYMYDDIKRELVLIDKEAENIRKYIEMQKLRIGHTADIHFKYETDNGTSVIPPMLLMTFVENAIKYGINPNEHSDILINITVTEGQLKFLTRNNIYKAPFEFVEGEGISNCKQRLTLLYPERHTLNITHDNNIFSVNLTINLDS